MDRRRTRKAPRPLDEASLNELALHYVGRFATTRAKLQTYLARKVRERGWDGTREPDLGGLATRFAAQGYVDDAAYALAKSQSLTGRGYGKQRVMQTLRAAGVDDDEGRAARRHAEQEAVDSALRFARRRRLGPFAASAATDPRERQKALAAMIRAGHGFGLARVILELAPGAEVNIEQLHEHIRLADD